MATNYKSIANELYLEGRAFIGGKYVDAIDGLGLHRGGGLMIGAHGLTVGFGLWSSRFTSESSDREHASFGIVGSAAGPLLTSTVAARPGPCVIHATAAPATAAALAAQLSDGESGDPRIKEALALGVIRKPLYSVAAEVMRIDRMYGGDSIQA